VSQYSLHCCRQSSSTFEKYRVFQSSNHCSHLSAATGTQCSAVHHHWHVGVVVGSPSNYQTGENLMVCQYCPPNFFNGPSSAHTCVWLDIVEEKLLRLSVVQQTLTNDSETADFLVFHSAVRVCCGPSRQEIYMNNCLPYPRRPYL
jgi:hypothetical protein